MIKKVLLLIIIVIFTIDTCTVHASEQNNKEVLVIYDNPNILNGDIFGGDNDFSVLFSEQLGHFDTSVDVVNERDYKKGMVENYHFIFYLSLKEKGSINHYLLEDFKATRKTVVWYGEGIVNLLNRYEKLPLKYCGTSSEYNIINYNNRKIYLGLHSGRNILVKPLSDEIKVYGEINNGLDIYPLIVNWHNFWYMSGIDTSGIKYLIFSDVLHNIFEEEHGQEKKVYLRIEDVHAFRSPERLRKIADYLDSQDVPFIIALIPAYVNPSSGENIPITQKPEIVEAVRYMVDRGGTVVLHGYTHQHYMTESGEGFEFWDAYNDTPLQVDYSIYVRERVKKGLKICLENDLYPLAFEAPHYAVSRAGYFELKKYFSTIVGQLQTTDKKFISGAFPYDTSNTNLANRFLPESLGYVAIDGSTGVQEILEQARSLLVVRDAVTGVFFHSFMDIEDLKGIVQGLKSMGYSFGDLKQEDNWVKIDGYCIKSSKGNIEYIGPKVESSYKTVRKKKLNMAVEIIATFLAIFVIMCLVMFVVKYINLKRYQKKKMFEVKN